MKTTQNQAWHNPTIGARARVELWVRAQYPKDYDRDRVMEPKVFVPMGRGADGVDYGPVGYRTLSDAICCYESRGYRREAAEEIVASLLAGSPEDEPAPTRREP